MKSPEEILSDIRKRQEVKRANTFYNDSLRIEVRMRKGEHSYPVINKMAKEQWRVEATNLGGDKIVFTTVAPE